MSPEQPEPADPLASAEPVEPPSGRAPVKGRTRGAGLATIAVTAGRPPRTPDAPTCVPAVLTSTYVAGGELGYGRYGNPTWSALEEALGALEGGQAVCFASGMAAVTATVELVPDGSAVVVAGGAYNVTLALLEERQRRGRLRVRVVDVADTGSVVAALDGAAMVWLESPSNPLLEVADLATLCAAARERGALAVVDSTFATPVVQRPLGLGAHVVVHAVTKALSGHSDVLAGAAATRDQWLLDRLRGYRSMQGAVLGPMEAWLALRGLRTLHLRMERAQRNAVTIATRLAAHPLVTRVRFPGLPDDPHHRRAAQMDGFGTVVAIQVAGGAAAADRLCAATRVWLPSTSLGGVESQLERRRAWPAEHPAVPESLVRLSVGVEDVEDLWADLQQALESAGGMP